VVKEFVEVESGKVNTRPKLTAALHLAKVTGSVLVIAKLDRLSRNATFLLALRDSGVRFVAADMPDANELTVGIMALVAQQEREAISKRTKEALQAAKRRGTVLGNPNGAEALRKAGKGNTAGVQAIQFQANAHAEDLRSVVQDLAGEGITSLGMIAKTLNDRGIQTPRGGAWYKTSVSNLLTRLKATA
jgi:DNA invertase Pin-like site-specific DNA recombinase